MGANSGDPFRGPLFGGSTPGRQYSLHFADAARFAGQQVACLRLHRHYEKSIIETILKVGTSSGYSSGAFTLKFGEAQMGRPGTSQYAPGRFSLECS